MAAVLIGLLFVGEITANLVGINEIILVEVGILLVIVFALWHKLKKYGVQRYREIEIWIKII